MDFGLRLRSVIWFLGCVFSVAAVSHAQEAEQALVAKTRYLVNGWPVRVNLVPEKAEIRLGEPLFLEHTITNASKVSLTLRVSSEGTYLSQRPRRIYVVVKDGEGNVLPVPASPAFDTVPSLGSERGLPRNGKYVTRLLLSDWAEITQPGTYTVTATRVVHLNRQERGWKEGMLHESSFDAPTCVEATVRVLEPDSDLLGKMIEQLGAAMLGTKEAESFAAAQRLALFEDDRIIPFMAEAAEKKEGWLQINALRALSCRPTEAAVDALVKALSVTWEDFPEYGAREEAESHAELLRAEAAALLLANKHPKAAQELLARRDDSSPGIRRAAVNALANGGGDNAKVILQEMAERDPEREVREAAKTALES